jgi:hypothetical protein
MRKMPDINIIVSDLFSDEYIELLESELKTEGLDLVITVRKHQSLFVSLEWAIPTFMAAYILKPYFDGFLKEAGKDHYSVLKNWLTTNMKTLKPITTETIAAENSPNKIDKNNTQSKVFSIESITLDGVHLKFLFDNNLSIENWILLSEKSLEILENHFTNYPSDTITIQTKDIHKRGSQIFGLINPETLSWEFADINGKR